MSNTLVVGGQWGDEAKGKIVHRLARKHDVVVRYNGGNNAGHTLDNVTLHLIPSGILYDHTLNIMAQGMVINPVAFYEEYRDIVKRTGVYPDREHLLVSRNAHLILPQHIAVDLARSKQAVGSTGRGIGPAYSQKADRIGIRVADLYERCELEGKVARSVEAANKLLPEDMQVKGYDVMRTLDDHGHFLLQFAGDAKGALKEARASGKNILFEGAQGTLLDVECGTYPNVTSSYTMRPSASQLGCYVPIQRALGVFKTPMSRVGKGPFPTEWGGTDGSNETRHLIPGEEAAMRDEKASKELQAELLEKIRNGTADAREWGAYFGHKGKEYGATTGRARRLGPLDMPLVRYACDANGLDGIVLTKMDVYSGIPSVPLCDKYFDHWGREISDLEDLNRLESFQPHVRNLPGWENDMFGATDWGQLPDNAQKYVLEVEKLAGIPIAFVSTGPKSEQLIVRQGAEAAA